MDGKYRNKYKDYIYFLDKWVEKFISQLDSHNESFYDDCHIDEISPVFEEKNNWISGALELFELYKNYLNNSELNIVLCIFLNRTKIKDNIPNSINKKNLNRIMTPPSFYLFKKGNLAFEKPTNYIIEKLSLKYKCNVYFGQSQELPPEQQFFYRYLYFVRENNSLIKNE